MKTRGDRIRWIMKVYDLTQEQFAERISRATGTKITRGAVGNWVLDKGIKTDNVDVIVSVFPGASHEWLMTGRGRQPTEADAAAVELQFVEDLRSRGVSLPEKLLRLPDDEGPPRDDRALFDKGHGKVLTPGALAEMDLRGGAGGGGYPLPTTIRDGQVSYDAEVVRAEWILPASYVRDELRVQLGSAEILAVEGDSMEPVLRSGDRVLVNRGDRNIKQGGVYAVREGESVIIKHVTFVRDSEPPRIVCKSANPVYDPFELVLDGSNDVIGRVVWRSTRM